MVGLTSLSVLLFEGVVALYKAIIGGSLPPMSAHSKPSHTKHVSA